MNEKQIVAYHRVSPTKHDRISTEGLKLSQKEVQENLHRTLISSIDMCEKSAIANGDEIEHNYIDEYRSGKDQSNMTNFKQMIKDAEDGKISKLYIRRVNRFGRNLNQSMQSMIDLDALGINIIAVENGIDTSKPFGRSLMALFIEFAEQERESWEEARIEGIEKAIAAGVKFGCPKKEINVKELRRSRIAPIGERSTWKQLENLHNASRSTLIKNLKDFGYWDYERRCVI